MNTDNKKSIIGDITYLLPQIYEGKLSVERINKYKKISEDLNIQEGTVRDIFCAGADWYKSILKRRSLFLENEKIKLLNAELLEVLAKSQKYIRQTNQPAGNKIYYEIKELINKAKK